MSTEISAPITTGLVTVSDGAEAVSVSICYDPAFYQRVAQIATEVAYQVCREEDSGATIAGHVNRHSKALQWFAQSSVSSSQIALAMLVAGDNATNEASTSQEIADRISTVWDTYSGN